MLAEIHGKISPKGSNLSERLEDQLTGNVFGTIRYLPSKKVLIPFLERAYCFKQEQKFSLELDKNFKKEPIVDFWLREYPGIEPDVRISFLNEDIVILIEVKYHSGLSSDDDNKNKINFSESNNQLVKQIRALREKHKSSRKIEVFLTTDIVYPWSTMNYVKSVMSKENIEDVEIYWLSWHEISSILRDAIQHEENIFCRQILNDLINYSESKNFEKYRGISNMVPILTWRFQDKYSCSGVPSITFFKQQVISQVSRNRSWYFCEGVK